MMNTHNLSLLKATRHILGSLSLLVLTAGITLAQGVGPIVPSGGVEYSQPGSVTDTGVPGGSTIYFDRPTAHSSMPLPPGPPPPTGFNKALQAVCWYIPNRLMDITDIPRVYVTAGDGQGVSLRATRFLTASWFEDEAYCLGWTKRTPLWFGEQVQERYFGFFAAQEGTLHRDPTEIGLAAHLLIVGFNVAISLGEAADAITGLVGIDLMGDDHGPVMFDTTQPNPEAAVLQQAVYGPQGPVRTNALPQGIAPPLPKSTPAPGNSTADTTTSLNAPARPLPPPPPAEGVKESAAPKTEVRQEPALPSYLK